MHTPLSAPHRFATLLRREWLQHRTGWMVITALPVLVGVLLLFVSHVQFSINDQDASVQLSQVPAAALAMVTIVGTGVLGFVLAWSASLLQAPGLARRDQQDRSIEFWLSLPVGHGAAIGAPLLAHLLLFPLAALAAGLLAGHVLALLLVARFAGAGEWFSLPWGWMLLSAASLGLRATLGLVLATLWLSPLIGLLMAASAWLKRWGLPAVLGGTLVLGNVLDKLYGNPVVWDLGSRLLQRAGQSFVTGAQPGGLRFGPGHDTLQVLRDYPAWTAADAAQALANLADPLLPAALGVAAICFGLLVLRRRRGA